MRPLDRKIFLMRIFKMGVRSRGLGGLARQWILVSDSNEGQRDQVGILAHITQILSSLRT